MLTTEVLQISKASAPGLDPEAVHVSSATTDPLAVTWLDATAVIPAKKAVVYMERSRNASPSKALRSLTRRRQFVNAVRSYVRQAINSHIDAVVLNSAGIGRNIVLTTDYGGERRDTLLLLNGIDTQRIR